MESTFNEFGFSEKSKLIMKNWEAIYECEDERDADWLCKKAALAKESQALTFSMVFDDEIIDVIPEIMAAKKDFAINSILLKLLELNWLKEMQEHSSSIQTKYIKTLEIPGLTKTLQTWRTEMKSQEYFIFACH